MPDVALPDRVGRDVARRAAGETRVVVVEAGSPVTYVPRSLMVNVKTPRTHTFRLDCFFQLRYEELMPRSVTALKPRRTQAERRAATRAQLLDATIVCLHERGYAGTTTTE